MTQKIAILIETKGARVKPAMLGVITAARAQDHVLYGLVADGAGENHRDTLARFGVEKTVNLWGGGAGQKPGEVAPDALARAVVQALDHFQIDIVFGLASTKGKDLLARVAALWDAPLALDCLSVDLDNDIITKTQYSGKTIATFRLSGARRVLGLRPKVFPAAAAPTSGEVLNWRSDVPAGPLEVLSVESGDPDDVALSEADIIIAGGRAMGNGENFQVLNACARALGGVVGASRVAVDSGWVPHTMQVGQTGTTVCPKLYIACGISGAVQHFAGMKTAEVIVAINQDPDAPLMQGCDYGIVGNLFEIVPLLTKALKAASE